MLKLPRTSLEPDQLAAVKGFFVKNLQPVWEHSEILISRLSDEPILRDSLRVASRTGCITRGLETITKFLDAEKKGLDQLRERTGQPAAQRMSRLLLFSNDGSERFYRQIASLLKAHGTRVWGCRVDMTDDALGALAIAPEIAAKAVLINDKKALASFLTELARYITVQRA